MGQFDKLLAYTKDIQISALRTTSRTQISNYLDQEGRLVGDYTNDWYGLAEIIGYRNLEIRKMEQSDTPTMTLLKDWATRAHLKPTIDNLIRHLVAIQRTDVIQDCEKNIKRDVDELQTRSNHVQPVVQAPTYDDSERYDAFVVYSNDDKDIKFMVDMAKILEGEEHNVKLFIPGRDDIAGTEKYTITADLIANRCRRVVVILSKGFKDSEDCDFALKLAQSLSPGAKSKRIIPILIDQVQIPLILNFVGVVDFTNPMLREWAWPRVATTIKAPLVPFTQDLACTIDDLKNLRYNSKNVAHMFYGLGVACRDFPDPNEDAE